MNKPLAFLVGIVMILFFAAPASALYFTDAHDDNFVWFSRGSGIDTYTWSFDLDNDILDWGDINSEDDINFAYLQFTTLDDMDRRNEYTNISLDFNMVVNGWEVDPAWGWGNVTAFVVDDHFLNVTFDRLSGDFGVAAMRIWGDYTDNGASSNAAPVPEPATMLLLGTGLIGVAGVSRKKLRS